MSAGGLWAVLPVKAWSEAKRRLSPILSDGERQEFARAMLDDVIAAIRGASRIDDTLAVTSDPVAAGYLERSGCRLVPEPRRGLNRALATAADELTRRGAATMLVLPIDLPLAASADLDELCARHLALRALADGARPTDMAASTYPSAAPATVTAAPDRFRSGTNALACSPPGCIPFRFGDGSFHAHLHEAGRRHAAAAAVVLDGLSLDVDHPDDMAELLHRDELRDREQAGHGARRDRMPASRSASFLRSLGVAARLRSRAIGPG